MFTFGERAFTFGERTFTFGDNRGFRAFGNLFLLLRGFGTPWVGGPRRRFPKYLTCLGASDSGLTPAAGLQPTCLTLCMHKQEKSTNRKAPEANTDPRMPTTEARRPGRNARNTTGNFYLPQLRWPRVSRIDRRKTLYFHRMPAIRANRLKPAIRKPPEEQFAKKRVQFGNPETIRENQVMRANLRIDLREAGHLSAPSPCFGWKLPNMPTHITPPPPTTNHYVNNSLRIPLRNSEGISQPWNPWQRRACS